MNSLMKAFSVCVTYLRSIMSGLYNYCDSYQPLDMYFEHFSMNNTSNNTGNCGELLNELDPPEEKDIETVDLFTNEIIYFKESLLHYQGRKYLLTDISNKWKKDCRMWLWKNPTEKRVGDLCNTTAAFKMTHAL